MAFSLTMDNALRPGPETSRSRGLSMEPCTLQAMCGDYCPKCRPDCMVFLSHRDCWKLAFSTFQLKRLDWSRLAVQARPFDLRRYDNSVGCYEYPGRTVLPSLALLRRGTPVGGLLSKVSCLPSELQSQIMGLLKGTMVASMLQTEAFILELLPNLHNRSSSTLQPHKRPLNEGRNTSLYCFMIQIAGHAYLNRLALTPVEGSETHIVVAKTAVRGVQFALGWFGLRGMRILYEDGSFSPWLGESTSTCWIGTVHCSNLLDLEVVANVSHSTVSIRHFWLP